MSFKILTRMCGAAVTGAAGGALYWVHGKSTNLPPEQRGDFSSRAAEVGKAFFVEKMRFTRGESGTSLMDHVSLVASLSAPSENDPRIKEEERASHEKDYNEYAYVAGKIQGSEEPTPVFSQYVNAWYDNHIEEWCSKNYTLLGGRGNDVFDPATRKRIIEGNYMRCRTPAFMVKNEQQKEAILTDGNCTGWMNRMLRVSHQKTEAPQ